MARPTLDTIIAGVLCINCNKTPITSNFLMSLKDNTRKLLLLIKFGIQY